MAGGEYRSFRDFYPFYLSEHSKRGTRRLHFLGTLLVLITLGYALAAQRWRMLALLPSSAMASHGSPTSRWSGTGLRPSSIRSTVWPATSACSPTCSAAA